MTFVFELGPARVKSNQ